jgi:peptidoglycan hydrolase-like protein with peptidoglycan-binding domain
MRIFTLHQSGTAIRLLQRALNEILNTELLISGHFDQCTQSALEAYQLRYKLNERDRYGAVYGLETQSKIEGYIEDRFLTDAGYLQAAALLDVNVATTMMLAQVLSTQSGFLTKGELLTRFERHLFYANIQNSLGKEEADAMSIKRSDLCNPRPGFYEGGIREHRRLTDARAYHATAALKSASYGLFQLQGSRYLVCGYPSVESFYDSLAHSEKDQILAFCRLLKTDVAMHDALKRKDWEGFARRYYGGAYSQGDYGRRMGNAYLSHCRDTLDD